MQKYSLIMTEYRNEDGEMVRIVRNHRGEEVVGAIDSAGPGLSTGFYCVGLMFEEYLVGRFEPTSDKDVEAAVQILFNITYN